MENNNLINEINKILNKYSISLLNFTSNSSNSNDLNSFINLICLYFIKHNKNGIPLNSIIIIEIISIVIILYYDENIIEKLLQLLFITKPSNITLIKLCDILIHVRYFGYYQYIFQF